MYLISLKLTIVMGKMRPMPTFGDVEFPPPPPLFCVWSLIGEIFGYRLLAELHGNILLIHGELHGNILLIQGELHGECSANTRRTTW